MQSKSIDEMVEISFGKAFHGISLIAAVIAIAFGFAYMDTKTQKAEYSGTKRIVDRVNTYVAGEDGIVALKEMRDFLQGLGVSVPAVYENERIEAYPWGNQIVFALNGSPDPGSILYRVDDSEMDAYLTTHQAK